MVPVDMEYMEKIAKEAIQEFDNLKLNIFTTPKGYKVIDVEDSNGIVIYCIAREVKAVYSHHHRVSAPAMFKSQLVDNIRKALEGEHYYIAAKERNENI